MEWRDAGEGRTGTWQDNSLPKMPGSAGAYLSRKTILLNIISAEFLSAAFVAGACPPSAVPRTAASSPEEPSYP